MPYALISLVIFFTQFLLFYESMNVVQTLIQGRDDFFKEKVLKFAFSRLDF